MEFGELTMKQFFLKDDQDCDIKYLLHLHPNMLTVLAGLRAWFVRNRKDLVITSIYRDDSSSHKDFRAIDIRTRELTYDDCYDLYKFLVTNYYEYSAYSRSGNKNLVVHFNENPEKKITWDHFHIQVQRTIVDK